MYRAQNFWKSLLLAGVASAGLFSVTLTAAAIVSAPANAAETKSTETPDGQGEVAGYSEPQPSSFNFSGNMAIFGNNYHYKESVNNNRFVEHSGELNGGAEFNWRVGYDIFSVGTDLTLKGGKARYASSSGYSPDEAYQIIEPRAIVGLNTSFEDWNSNPITLYPYTGFGYRYYYNDGRSPLYSGNRTPSLGGYRRQTEYWYMPFGITIGGEITRLTPSPKSDRSHETNEFWQNRITWKFNFEYDLLINAKNRSFLGDIYGCYGGGACPDGISLSDLTIENKNDIGSGRGIKTFLEFGYNNISMGPYFDSWEINRYKSVDKNLAAYPEVTNQSGSTTSFYEPANVTTEVGIRLRLGF